MTINHAHRFFIFHLKQKAQKMYDKIWENLNILASLNMHLWFFPPFSPTGKIGHIWKKKKKKHILMYRNLNKDSNTEI